MKIQTNEDIQTYMTYISEVLGISKVYNMENVNLSNSDILNSDKLNSDKLMVYIEDLNLFNPQEIELLDKMLSALKLNEDQYLLQDLNLYLQAEIVTNQNSNKPKLFLLNALESQKKALLEKANRSDDIFTWSPQILIKKPELKRQAWNELQLLIRRLQ